MDRGRRSADEPTSSGRSSPGRRRRRRPTCEFGRVSGVFRSVRRRHQWSRAARTRGARWPDPTPSRVRYRYSARAGDGLVDTADFDVVLQCQAAVGSATGELEQGELQRRQRGGLVDDRCDQLRDESVFGRRADAGQRTDDGRLDARRRHRRQRHRRSGGQCAESLVRERSVVEIGTYGGDHVHPESGPSIESAMRSRKRRCSSSDVSVNNSSN